MSIILLWGTSIQYNNDVLYIPFFIIIHKKFVTDMILCVLRISFFIFRGYFETQLVRWILGFLCAKQILEIWRRKRDQRMNENLVETCLSCWLLFNALLQRPHNVLLMGSLLFQSRVLHQFSDVFLGNSVVWLTISHVWMGMVYYFYQVWLHLFLQFCVSYYDNIQRFVSKYGGWGVVVHVGEITLIPIQSYSWFCIK